MANYTPMMTHYLQIKEKYPDTLIFYRLGDFYEMFFEDAKTASHELDLVLTGRNAGVEEKVPMCGVPFHAVKSYLQRLIAKGYKVAIVEQLEDPSEAVGLVKRDVIRVVTPGTAMDEMMDEKTSVFIASICDYKYGFAIAGCEMTTGEAFITNISHDAVLLKQTLLANSVREVVVGSDFDQKVLKGIENLTVMTISICDESLLKEEYKPLCEQLSDIHYLEAIGRLFNYLEVTQKRSIAHIMEFKENKEDDYLKMDFSSMRNLELTEASANSNRNVTLWSFLDKTRSAAGSRMLKKWVQKPLRNKDKINQRLDMIAYLNKNYLKREKLKELLSELYDLERLIARVGYGNANGRDLLRLQKSLAVAPAILALVKDSGIYPEFNNVDSCDDLYKQLKDSIVEEPPVSTKEGGIFKDGYNELLDEYRMISRNGQKWIAQLEQQERDKTGIKNLKIGYNRVFGYYIEISKGNVGLVKDEWGYTRKQTLTTGERFITSELKEKEDAILHAEEKSIKLESQLFDDLLVTVKKYLTKLQKLANCLAVIDAVYALTVISSGKGYVRPAFSEDGLFEVKAGRHPILEAVNKSSYIPNDIYMDNQKKIVIITGPNMGGKSTYMRQCILIALLAQIGCYVPAKSAVVPIFDQLFTRIGSTDDILGGQSTFMVEMVEANNALQHATKDSLIVFDEIGRGTSTYDGMALAQAMLEYIDAAIGAKTLFSTHYHELTSLENNMNGIINKHVQVHEENEKVTFLYKVKPGKANRSYGIHVAALAKLPESVIDRSQELLKGFENTKSYHNDQSQIIMVEKVPTELKEIKDILSKVDPNNMTPLEALTLVNNLKGKLKGE